MMLIPDNRRRVTLPPSFKAGQPVALEPLEDGTFRLVPMVAIPAHQLWAWRPEVQEAVERALAEYQAGKAVALDGPAGQAFLKALDEP
ncbi:MAG: AbrB/MazE/SpoVT family DNA-binding domain-containing protein [Holophaga sp.]|nr:AbrB/MazE/SpoVT family DNA-binding domain-containing protein [Holophaga sp.]